MKLIFAGKYCKKLQLENFKEYDFNCIGEFDDYSQYLETADIIISYGYGRIFKKDA